MRRLILSTATMRKSLDSRVVLVALLLVAVSGCQFLEDLGDALNATVPRIIADNGDGTVTHLGTGLVWLKDANCFGLAQWQTAIEAARSRLDA